MQQLILLIMALFIGCNENKISFINIEENMHAIQTLSTQERTIAESYINNATKNDYKLITTKELKAKLDSNDDMEIIAVVPRGIYSLGFIRGAKNFEFGDEFSGNWGNDTKNTQDKFIGFLGDKQQEIIFYDNGTNNATTAAIWAKKLGYENVSILVGGFVGWRERDFEISFDMPECCRI